MIGLLCVIGSALVPGPSVVVPATRGMAHRQMRMAVETGTSPLRWVRRLFNGGDDNGEEKVELTRLNFPRKSMSIPKGRTGTSYLPEETVERAEQGTKFEKIKLEKDPTSMFTDIYDYAAKIRSGELDWKAVEDADINTRFKWLGLLHRAKRAPGSFMMRLRVLNGIVTAEQMRFYADSVEPFGPEQGVIDITTRQNIQLRGLTADAATDVIDGLHALNQTCIQTGFDNIRNMVGNPLAGIDENEMVDTRPFCNMLNDLVTLDEATGQRGNPVYCNLPRKFNICVSGNRDDYSHTHINDIGFVPTPHATTGEMGFNVVFGGYMSIKRVAESIPCDIWIPATLEASRSLSQATLRIFRDEGDRKDRQKARLMWIIERYGVEAFREKLLAEPALAGIRVDQAQPAPSTAYERRELLGVHQQPNGRFRVGIHVPAGRLSVVEARQIADLGERYSGGEIRLTVEQNALLPNVDESMLAALLAEPALTGDSRMSVEPGHIVGHTVSCTGSQFCGLAMIETKASAERIATKLDALVSVPRPLRIHWTGCPNSCGQVQVADIGLMGGPAKKLDEASGKMKAVPGVSIFVGGKVGENAFLALEPYKTKVPMADDDLLPELVAIAKEHFGAVDK
jgi:ferredoxin-nitrite reductase